MQSNTSNQIRVLVLRFCLMLLLLICVATTSQVTSAQQGWHTYSGLGDQVTVDYPQNYQPYSWKPYKHILASVSFMDGTSSQNQEHPDALEASRFAKRLNQSLDSWFAQVSTARAFGSAVDMNIIFFEPQQLRALKADRTVLSFWHRVEGEPVFVVLIDRPSEVVAMILVTSDLEASTSLFRDFVGALKIDGQSISGIMLDELNQISKPVYSNRANSLLTPRIAGYYLPWQNGVTRNVNQGWGPDPCCSSHDAQPNYYAYDFGFNEGTEVWASAPGTVAYSRTDVDPATCGGSSYANTTNYVTVNHDDGRATTSIHLRNATKTSGSVSQGELLGYSGKTGWTGCGPHLHFQRQNQGGWFTNSVDLYFLEYSGQTFNQGTPLTSQNSRGGGGCNPNSDQIALFEHGGYGGSCKVLNKGDYANPSSMGFANDSASSIKVGGNVKAILCRDDNYNGGCEEFAGDDGNLGDNSIGDNQVSSVKVQDRGGSGGCNPNSDQVALFEHPNYGGNCKTFGRGDYPNPGSMGFANDSASSVKVGGNVKAVLCRDDNYNGGCEDFTGDDSDLNGNSIGDNQVSSLKVQDRGGGGGDGIEICDGTNYGTPCTTLTAGKIGNLNDIGWYDRIESLRFKGSYVGNYHVVLSTETGHGGTPGHFERDEPNLQDPWRNRTRSIEIYFIDRNNPPSVPTLSSPTDGYQSTDSNAPSLCWNSSSDPEGDNPVQYYAEVYDSPVNANSGWINDSCWRPASLDGQFNTYKWRVRARDNKNKESDWSATRTFTIPSNVAPSTPSNFRVTGTTTHAVSLAWDDVSRESGYNIYRWGYDGSQWTFIWYDDVPADTTTYTNRVPYCSTDYFYEVSSYNDYGESVHHSWVLGRTQDCVAVPNDELANATVISGNSFSTNQDSTNGTTASNDPVLPCGSVTKGSASVWYRFTPNSTGLLEVNTRGSDYDTMLAVWRGSAGNLTNIACDDDGGESVDSLLRGVYLYKGTTYYLEVTRYTAGYLPVEKPVEVLSDPRMPHPVPTRANANGESEGGLHTEGGGGNLNLALTFSPTVQRLNKMVDFDGDGKSDIGLFRPGTRVWYLRNSSTNQTTGAAVQWGLANDVPFTGEFDGDGRTDLGIYRPSNTTWYILKSTANYGGWFAVKYGVATDVPMLGDYDGDGKTDIALFRPSTRVWYVMRSSTNYASGFALQWGVTNDKPVTGDFDGDGRNDIGVFRPGNGTWYILRSSLNYTSPLAIKYGVGTDTLVPGDYDGDGRTDIALFRESTRVWYVLRSSSNYTTSFAQQWGLSGDKAVAGDFDGDGRTDMVLFRASNTTWYPRLSSSEYGTYWAVRYGASSDLTLPR